MNTNKNNNNKYGHLLDKYMDSNHVDYETKQQREEEDKNKYGHLLDYAKPDYSILELMSKMEDDRIERWKQKAKEKELENQRRQVRIEEERRKEDEHIAKARNYAESLIKRKQAKIKADADREEKECKEAEEQQSIYDRINRLMQISPESANAYVQVLKEGNLILKGSRD